MDRKVFILFRGRGYLLSNREVTIMDYRRFAGYLW